jgi:hypothetical protein
MPDGLGLRAGATWAGWGAVCGGKGSDIGRVRLGRDNNDQSRKTILGRWQRFVVPAINDSAAAYRRRGRAIWLCARLGWSSFIAALETEESLAQGHSVATHIHAAIWMGYMKRPSTFLWSTDRDFSRFPELTVLNPLVS